MADGTMDTRPPGGLKADAIGFVDALVIGLNATSPAYSLATAIGPVVALVGVYAPGVMLASFVPMLLIACIGIALAGVVLMVVWRLLSPAFWSERPEVADPDLVHGDGHHHGHGDKESST